MPKFLAIPLAVAILLLCVAARCMATYSLAGGVGDPWGTAIDQHGNVWFAEAGCDFEVNCSDATAPGQIGVLYAGSSEAQFYTLPSIAGNQPIFVDVDGAGHIWFTTPNNSRIGEFDPVTSAFVGQWQVTPGSGPWDLVFSDGAIWYTERFGSAIGRFDPSSHTHVDFPTPTANTHPYGIAARGNRVWFGENKVAMIGMLDTAKGNLIVEYQLQAQPTWALTPHMLTIDDQGNLWWSGGWLRAIGKIDPTRASPGSCGVSAGDCVGATTYRLPPPQVCGQSHVSGIAAQRGSTRIWLTDSLSGEMGSFDTRTATFSLAQSADCNGHSHDGLSVDGAGHVWWTQEFADTLNSLSAG